MASATAIRVEVEPEFLDAVQACNPFRQARSHVRKLAQFPLEQTLDKNVVRV